MVLVKIAVTIELYLGKLDDRIANLDRSAASANVFIISYTLLANKQLC